MNNEQYDLQDWTLPSTGVTTEKLDEEVRKLISLEEDYDAKKKISNEANEKYETQRTYILNLLKETGKTKYYVEGLGTVSMAIKTSVTTPKEPSSKKAMVDYFLESEEDTYAAYLSVNHNTLNSYINQQLELDPDFVLPGCGEKKETPELRFRKER